MNELLSGTNSTKRKSPVVFHIADDVPENTPGIPATFKKGSDQLSVVGQKFNQNRQSEFSKKKLKRKNLPRISTPQEGMDSWVGFKTKVFNKHSFTKNK